MIIGYFNLKSESQKIGVFYGKMITCRNPKKPWDTPVGGNRVPESVASSLLHPATLRAPDVHGKSAPFRA